MTQKVIFIDDEYESRLVYQGILQEMFGDEYEVIDIEPCDTIPDMISRLSDFDELVSLVVDEKLSLTVGTDYQGTSLVDAFRAYDSKLPIYILTSEVESIPNPFGSVEFVIDKNEITECDYNEQCRMMMHRHINSYNDIKTARTLRFDELLKKSVTEGLSHDEQSEYESLDLVRIKRVLADESQSESLELDENQLLIEQIEEELRKLQGDK